MNKKGDRNGISDKSASSSHAKFEKSEDENEEQNPMVEKVNEYIKELLSEKGAIEKQFPIADRLIDQEISKIQQSGRIPPKEVRYVDIYREKPVRVAVKVLVPVREHPKFNFVGKLLGPKGNSLKRLQDETLCKFVVLGRGSMREREKEEELREAQDPKYAHLNDALHVEISTFAPPAEAHARIAYALAEVRKYLIPDSNDEIRQEQLRELIADGTLPPDAAEHKTGAKPYKGKMIRHGYPPKQSIMSILDKARSAIDESHDYEETIYETAPPPQFESYSYSHSEMVPSISRPIRHEEYEQKVYTREYYPREPKTHLVKSSPSSAGRSWKVSGGGYVPASQYEFRGRETRYRSAPYARPGK